MAWGRVSKHHQRYSTTYMSASTRNNLHSAIHMPRTAYNHAQVINHQPPTTNATRPTHATILQVLSTLPPAFCSTLSRPFPPAYLLPSLFSLHPAPSSLFLPSNLPWKSTQYILIPKNIHNINMSTKQAVHNLFNILYTYPQKMLSTGRECDSLLDVKPLVLITNHNDMLHTEMLEDAFPRMIWYAVLCCNISVIIL